MNAKAMMKAKANLEEAEHALKNMIEWSNFKLSMTPAGIPEECWDYKLGNRSGLEWILDQYKEKTPRDPTIREKFYTYRFADYKVEVIDLITRVTRVSVKAMQIVESMANTNREVTQRAPECREGRPSTAGIGEV